MIALDRIRWLPGYTVWNGVKYPCAVAVGWVVGQYIVTAWPDGEMRAQTIGGVRLFPGEFDTWHEAADTARRLAA